MQPLRPWYSPTKHHCVFADVIGFCIGFAELSGLGSCAFTGAVLIELSNLLLEKTVIYDKDLAGFYDFF
jgi:hypothetical protein